MDDAVLPSPSSTTEGGRDGPPRGRSRRAVRGPREPGGQVPPGLDRVVRHCLEKKREDRFQSARDVAFALETLGSSTQSVAAAVAPARRRRWLPVFAAVAVAGAFTALGVFGGRPLWEKSQPTFKQLTFRRGFADFARFAPDGRTVIYGAAWDGQPTELFMTRTDSPESRPLGVRFAKILSVSADGRMAVLLDPARRGGLHFGARSPRCRLPEACHGRSSRTCAAPSGHRTAVSCASHARPARDPASSCPRDRFSTRRALRGSRSFACRPQALTSPSWRTARSSSSTVPQRSGACSSRGLLTTSTGWRGLPTAARSGTRPGRRWAPGTSWPWTCAAASGWSTDRRASSRCSTPAPMVARSSTGHTTGRDWRPVPRRGGRSRVGRLRRLAGGGGVGRRAVGALPQHLWRARPRGRWVSHIRRQDEPDAIRIADGSGEDLSPDGGSALVRREGRPV